MDLVRSSYLIVLTASKDQHITWFGTGPGHSTNFIPLDSRLESLPDEVASGWIGSPNRNTLNYVTNRLNNVMDLRFKLFLPFVVQA